MQFKDYAKIYDLIYKDKEYAAETDYVLSVINKHAVLNSRSLLELGCGTGNYSKEFAKKGYTVTGLDLSGEMVNIATKRSIPGAKFACGDIRDYNLHTKFSLIVSLFHVFSYLNTDEDLRAFFSKAYDHLEKEGLLVFDFWNGEGVMADPPGNRKKEMQDEQFLLNRSTTATHNKEAHIVEVKFDFDVKDKQASTDHHFSELHRMRYFFEEEIKSLSANQFEIVAKYGWLSAQQPDSNNWYALYILKRL